MKNTNVAPRDYRPIPNQRLHEHVVKHLAHDIVGGAIPVGCALPNETALGQQFGVSRMVVREAMRILVAKGLVTVKHGSGMWVQPVEQWNRLDPLILFEEVTSGRDDEILEELLELRLLLEMDVAGLAARRRTDEDLATLRRCLAAMADHLHDPEAYTRFDNEFHELLLTATWNRLLREGLRPVMEALEVGRTISIRQPGAAEASLTGHQQILAAVECGDEEAARAAMGAHVRQFERDIQAGLRAASLEESTARRTAGVSQRS